MTVTGPATTPGVPGLALAAPRGRGQGAAFVRENNYKKFNRTKSAYSPAAMALPAITGPAGKTGGFTGRRRRKYSGTEKVP